MTERWQVKNITYNASEIRRNFINRLKAIHYEKERNSIRKF